MLQGIYTFSFIIAFIYLYVSVSVFKKRISVYYMMLFSCIMISNFGYMQMISASTLERAIQANQTTYLGASFSCVFLLFCIADLCKVNLNNKIKTSLIIFGALIFFLSGSYGTTDLYYKDLYIVEKFGGYLLKKKYGPLHNLFLIHLSTTFGGMIFIIIKSFFRRKVVSYKNSILLSISMMLTIIAYILEKTTELDIPLVPVSYDIGITLVFIILTRISMYDVAAIFSNIVSESDIGGIICIDKKGNFLGADDAAFKWFPETKNLSIDYRIPNNNNDLFTILWKWIKGNSESETVILKRDSRFYKLEHSFDTKDKFQKIHVIYIQDDTDQQTYKQRLEEEVLQKTEKIRTMQNDIIIGMASTIENRDSNTGGHIQRTSDVINIFVNYLLDNSKFSEISKEYWQNLIKAAPLHDFGKTGIPDSILNKPAKFTDEEYEIMKTHAAKGAEILNRILMNSDDTAFKNLAVNVAHYHHEKWNGTGYPAKLKETQIPFEARVMALADVFDALVSKRVYKESFSYDKAFSIIEESAGSHFDPTLCAEFLKCRPQLEALYNKYQ